MKAWFVSLFIFVVCVSSVIGYKQIEASGVHFEILDIVEELKDQNVTISQWSMYTKEEVVTVFNKESFFKKLSELKNTTSNFNWEVKEEEDSIKAIGIRDQPNDSIKEKIILSSTLKNDNPRTYLIYESIGIGWKKDQWQVFLPTFNKTKRDIFQENPTNFSCVKGNFNDTIEGVLLDEAKGLLNEFNAEIVEFLNEETFVSVTAYTEKWENYLPTITGKMNVQIALRKTGLGGKTTFVVGTPIITSEY